MDTDPIDTDPIDADPMDTDERALIPPPRSGEVRRGLTVYEQEIACKHPSVLISDFMAKLSKPVGG